MIARVGDIMFLGCPFISRMLENNSLKFGTIVHLDSEVNSVDFGGQRSKLKVTVTVCHV